MNLSRWRPLRWSAERKLFSEMTSSLIVTLLIMAPVSAFADEGVDFFEKKIRPVLVQHCYECHSAKAFSEKSLKGNLLLDTRTGLRKGGESGPGIVPGNVEESLLIKALLYETFEMPPQGKLPEEVINDFKKWVKLGAPDPRVNEAEVIKESLDIEKGRQYWAFQLPKRSPPPETKNVSWPKSDIDRFILAKLEQQGLSPAEEANRYSLLRRATYDLMGRPPTPQEIDDFINDPSAVAFESVVNRLLASPQFGERWGRYWLDLAQYGETVSTDFFFPVSNAWRYRDYVIKSLNDDKPYDQFIIEQLAGDQLRFDNEEDRAEQLIATGFIALGPWLVGLPKDEQLLMDLVDLQIDKVSRALLGMTTTCARCHDHKFDPIAQTDYYALAGIFRSTKTLDGNLGNKSAYLDWMRQPLPETPAAAQARELATVEHKAKLAELEAELQDVNTTKSRKEEILEKLDLLKGQLPLPPMAVAVGDQEQPKDCHITIRGNAKLLGEKVSRGFLRVAHDGSTIDIPTGQSGRLQLAQWIANANNPLTARVMVNRIWHHLFGVGLVKSVDNFGRLGDRPSHPKLLDNLAVQFIEEGWSIKTLIRQIMLSRVYQLGNQVDELAFVKDSQNRLLWRMNRRRLDADAIRDAILLASGNLNPARGGPTLPPIKVDRSGNRNEALVLATSSPSPAVLTRRSVYLPILRKEMPAELDILFTFNFADPAVVSGDRDETIVPTQALYLLNSPFIHQQSKVAGERLLKMQEFDDAERVNWFYLATLGRPSTPAEIETSLNFVNQIARKIESIRDYSGSAHQESWSRFCQSMFACNEFIFRD